VSNGAVRSANDFRITYRRLQADYERKYGQKVAEVRAALADPKRKNLDLEDALEAHVRTYLIDGILSALRWQIVSSTPAEIANMIPEAQVDPVTGNRRYMDYFGYEREVNQPLLVVEAKRPSKFPVSPGGSTETASETVSKWLRRPNSAPGEWKQWIPSLQQYVLSVFERTSQFPMRAAITDGNWLVIFEDPGDSFGAAGTRDLRFVHAFTDKADVDDRYDLVFRLLYQRFVSRFAPDVLPGAIAGLIDPAKVVQLLHGLLLRYATSETVGGLIPTISVTPTILLRSDTGSWIRVARSNDVYVLPYRYSELSTHLQEVRAAAELLLARVHEQLGQRLQPATLDEHYADDEAFEGMPGIEEMQRKSDLFRIVTGRFTHYLLPDPTVPNCPYHDFAKSVELHCQAGELPIINRSIETPRSYFTNTQLHHCCHEDVDAAKHIIISDENKLRCGVRSGRRGDVFCEIAPFDEFLCCRTCCFQQVCTATQVLRLPCVMPPAG
jgi:hypothetical protein